ncbi:hypothetical protein H2203_007141 [Taxawa tesnikishii (nom. ined.)]|nr:hypothetical protein H2203_007141 [Dothideales sp. JES 119]
MSVPSSTTKVTAHRHANVTLVGAGTIGLSFAALHLTANPDAQLTIYDTRPDLDQYVESNLPGYVSGAGVDFEHCKSRLHLANSLESAVSSADIIQEQGPENLDFKSGLWPQVEKYAPANALFWSSTSGIPASAQSANMQDQTRLTVVHPYNPPHIMPLLEVVPAPTTSSSVVERTLSYWRSIGRTPVVIQKETTGFVANRLAFALFREAISLVNAGIVSVSDLDAIVENSMGPRWVVAGPFKSYHAGGGAGGLQAFMQNIGGTVKDCWSASEVIKVGAGGIEQGWEESICAEAEKAYGRVDTGARDRITREVLRAVNEGKRS